MRLYIAGGCGEHGRNCFYVQGESTCFLLDCGVMAGEPGGGYPHLSQSQIDSLRCVFLTHSHADHAGALPWLSRHGYSGPIVATRATALQLPRVPPQAVPLESVCPGGAGRFGGLDIQWGRSGHCAGSVWYRFRENDKTILFTGDYTENTLVYPCDALRGKAAGLAVLDCAYGRDETSFAAACSALTDRVKALLDTCKLLLFPVPKYGRGLELRRLLADAVPAAAFYGDSLFLQNLQAMGADTFWYRCRGAGALRTEPYHGQATGIVFVSDPQLRTPAAQALADTILGLGGRGVMTGTVEAGTYSEQLLRRGQMELLRYPVHLNWTQYQTLAAQNRFGQYIPYHTGEFAVQSPIVF